MNNKISPIKIEKAIMILETMVNQDAESIDIKDPNCTFRENVQALNLAIKCIKSNYNIGLI